MRKKKGDQEESRKEMEKDRGIERFCFVCKKEDGHDNLRACDHLKCGKAYHHECVGLSKSSLTNEMDWICDRHSCFSCSGRPMIKCYCCPKAICGQCINVEDFSPIFGENGFCKECMEFARLIEKSTKNKKKRVYLPPKERHFMEYYKIVKKKEGFTVNDLQSAKKGQKIIKKRKHSSTLEEFNVKNILTVDSDKIPQNEEVLTTIPAVSFAALVYENVRLIFLRRCLIQKLMKQPETFEDKVKGAFVRVELPPNDVCPRKSHHLMQVTVGSNTMLVDGLIRDRSGVTRTLSDEGIVDVKLQVLNMPNDISINMLSNADFSEKECEDLKQQVKVGMLRKPTIEELERKARLLREDMVDDLISRELKMLQPKIDLANERGRRHEFYECLRRKEQLQAPSQRLRLIYELSTVIAEPLDVETMPEKIEDDRQGTEGSPESVQNNSTQHGHDKIASGGQYMSNCDMLCEGSTVSLNIKNVFAGDKTTSERSFLDVSPNARDLAQEHVRKQANEAVVKDARLQVPLTADTGKNSEQQIMESKQTKVIQEENRIIGELVEVTVKQPAREQESRCFIPPPLEVGVATPINLNPSMTQQSNHQLCSNRGNVRLDDAPEKLAQLHNRVFGEDYKDEELMKLGNQSKTQLFLLEKEILRRSGKIFEEHKRFDAENHMLKMDVVQAINKVTLMQDEMKRVEVKLKEEADRKISMVDEEANKKITMVQDEMKRLEVKLKEEADRKISMVEDELKCFKIMVEEEANKKISMAEHELKRMELNIQDEANKKISLVQDELDKFKVKMEEEEKNKLTVEDELKRLKAKMEEDAYSSAKKIASLEKKLHQLLDYQAKQIEEVQVQSAKEAIISYKKSKSFMNDALNMLEPIYNVAWSKVLEEFKAKMPDSDVSDFPRYGLKKGENLNPKFEKSP